MKNTKEQKAITLIALVITIIVLLILAGVALATLNGNTSIIDNANRAVEEYKETSNADDEIINKVEGMFAKYMGESSAVGDDDTQAKNQILVSEPATTSYTYDGEAKTVSATISGTSDYTAYYSTSSLNSSNYTSGNSGTILIGPDAGTYTVYYYIKSSDSNYADANGNFTITINKRQITLTGNSSSEKYDGQSHTVSGYTFDGELAVGDDIYLDNTTVTRTEVGISYMVLSDAVIKNAHNEDVTANYEITYVNGTLEITKITIRITD